MNTFFTMIAKRFLKGLLATIGGFSAQFLLQNIPPLVHFLPSVVHSQITLTLLIAGLLALEKALQQKTN